MKRFGLIVLGCVFALGVGCQSTQEVKLVTLPGPLVWGNIQSNTDTAEAEWNWLASDLVFKDQANHSMVAPLWPYALWDQATCHGDYPSQVALYGTAFQAPYTPCNTSLYHTWVTTVVGRYDGSVAAWQVLYEPHKQAAPLAQYADTPESYIQLLADTAQAIHEANEGAVVLSAVIPQLNNEALVFWGPVLQSAKFQDSVDAIAIAANSNEEWQVAKSVIERYTLTKPVWVFTNQADANFDGAKHIVVTQ